MNKTVFIYGPQGCGKTRHADDLARFFRVDRVIDGFDWDQPVPLLNCLVLTHDTPPVELDFARRVLSFDQAMTLAGLKHSHMPPDAVITDRAVIEQQFASDDKVRP